MDEPALPPLGPCRLRQWRLALSFGELMRYAGSLHFSPQAEYPNLTHVFNAKVHFVSVANISPLADVQSMWTAMAKVGLAIAHTDGLFAATSMFVLMSGTRPQQHHPSAQGRKSFAGYSAVQPFVLCGKHSV